MDPSLLHAIDPDMLSGALQSAQLAADQVPAWLGGHGFGGGEIQLAQTTPTPAPPAPPSPAPPTPGTAPAPGTAPDPNATPGIKTEDVKPIKVKKVGEDASEDFSLIAIILRADLVVKVVIGLLVLMSIWSWAVIFDKLMLVRRMHKRANRFEEEFWSGGSVDDLYERVSSRKPNPMAAVFMSAMREWRKSGASERKPGELMLRGGVQERIDRAMNIGISREMEQMERQVGLLATVGSTAPFIGLFGTVWGIMNSFREIAVQKNTNLATVAPGISEALFATALGLVAAIPAVIAYNKLTNDLDRYAQRLEGFAGEFSGIVSRQIESAGS